MAGIYSYCSTHEIVEMVVRFGDVVAGMSMEDIREYEKRLHDETNKLVGCSADEPASSTAAVDSSSAPQDGAAAGAADGNDESPGTPSNTPTEKAAPFEFPASGETPASFQ